jgi:hypothetical protein
LLVRRKVEDLMKIVNLPHKILLSHKSLVLLTSMRSLVLKERTQMCQPKDLQ